MSKQALVPIIVFTILFLTWEFCSRAFSDLVFILPPPSKILFRLWEKSDRFLFHTQVTLKEMAGGFVLAFLAAFPLAWVMSLWNSARLVLQSLFVVIQCIPMFALAPLMVFWFDWSYTAIVIPTALMIFFPLTMNVYQGLNSTPKHLLDFFQVHNATTWQTFTKLQLPWALPHIFAGFRISAAIAGIGAIAGEWAGAQSGLGLLMLESRRGADLETTFGALFCLTFVSLSLYGITVSMEKRIATRRPLFLPFRKWVHKRLQRSRTRPLSKTTLGCAPLFLLLCFLVAACQQSDKKPESTRIVLDWLPNPNHVPLYVGIDKGLFEKQGIHLFISKLRDPGDAVALLTAGKTDLAIAYMPQTLRAISRGIPLKIVGSLIEEPLRGLIFRKGEGIVNPKDLSGKVIGYCVDGSNTAFLDVLLNNNGISPGPKRNVSFDLVSTLATERVDVIYGAYWNIETEHIRSFGIDTDCFKVTELGVPNYHELIVLSRPGSPEAEIEFINRFQIALQESIDFCKTHESEAFNIYFAANPDKGEQTRQWERQAWNKTCPALASNQEIDVREIDKFNNWLETHNLMN